MSRLRRLLLTVPVASLFVAGAAFGQEPAKMTPAASGQPAVTSQPAVAGAPCGAATMVIAGQPCNSCGMQVACGQCCEPCGPKIGFFFDGLYLKVRNNDIPYARPVDDLTLSLTSGPIGQVSQDWETGYRFGGWYAVTPEVMIRAQYLSFSTNQTDAQVAGEGLLLQSLVTAPETGNNSIGFLNAAAGSDLDLKTLDVDAVFTLSGGCDRPGRIAAVVGFRWARLEQEFGAAFTSAQSTELVAASSNIEGWGPRLGLEGDVTLGRGFYGYGSGVFSLLVGHQNAQYLHGDEFQGLLVATSYEKDRIVGVFDLELGIGVTCLRDHLNVRLGYMLSTWGNLVTTNGLIQSVQQNDFTTNRDNLRDNLTFDGVVLRAEVRW